MISISISTSHTFTIGILVLKCHERSKLHRERLEVDSDCAFR